MSSFPLTSWGRVCDAQEGECEARDELSETYRSPLEHYFRKYGMVNEAEDLAQEVLIRVFHGGVLERADPQKGRFRSLLCAVARNVLLSHFQRINAKKRGGGNLHLLGNLDLEVVAPTRTHHASRRLSTLSSALKQLAATDPHYHQAIVLHFMEGKTQQAVAQDMDRSLRSVQHLLRRGKRRLAQYVARESNQNLLPTGAVRG